MSFRKIWSKVLTTGEIVEYEFSLSLRYLYINLTFWAIIGLATVWIYGLGAVIFLTALFYYGYFLRISNAYAFTNKRILIHRGWLSTSIESIDFSKIVGVNTSQDFVEKIIMGSGRIMIDTAGTNEYEIVLTRIADPYMVKQKLSELMDKDEQAKRAAGMHPVSH